MRLCLADAGSVAPVEADTDNVFCRVTAAFSLEVEPFLGCAYNTGNLKPSPIEAALTHLCHFLWSNCPKAVQLYTHTVINNL